jgi:hypothetical protein
MLILGEGYANLHFSRGWKGDMWLVVVFIIMTLQKPKGSFGEMGEGKKGLFVGFIDSHFRLKKSDIVFKKDIGVQYVYILNSLVW